MRGYILTSHPMGRINTFWYSWISYPVFANSEMLPQILCDVCWTPKLANLLGAMKCGIVQSSIADCSIKIMEPIFSRWFFPFPPGRCDCDMMSLRSTPIGARRSTEGFSMLLVIESLKNAGAGFFVIVSLLGFLSSKCYLSPEALLRILAYIYSNRMAGWYSEQVFHNDLYVPCDW